MEEITLDETETVSLKGTKTRRSSILKQRTPLQVIEPNRRRVSFSVKQTKEFHSCEAPFVLGSSYEETFQSDSPKSIPEPHFTMKMVHSSTTEANMVFRHDELLNTTHFINLDDFDSSETECEARMSIDIQQTETQHYGLGIEEITQSRQGSINWNKQMENVENLTPELLNHIMKKQEIQAPQKLNQPGNKSLLNHAAEKAVNISCNDTSNIKAKVWQHHSSQTFLECSFPSSHIVRNEGMRNKEIMPHDLNKSENKEFIRGASPLTELDKDTLHINNDKLMMDADMDFTDVILINKTDCGSYTTHVNNAMDLTKGIFCRGTNNNDEAQGYGDLNESEIEFTNTVGHIAISESDDTLTKISEIKVLEYDSGSISDLLNAQNAATKYMHKINAHHLQPSNATVQAAAKLSSAIDSNKIHTMAATTLEEKKCVLEKSDAFQMPLCANKKEDLNGMTLKFTHDSHADIIDAMGSRTNTVNESNSKSITNISNASCTELTNASWRKLAADISQSSQTENIGVTGYKLAVKIPDGSHLELTDAVRCNTPTKHIDSHLELTNVCKPIMLTNNISSNIQTNDDSANDSQLEFTNVIYCKSVPKVSNSCMELTNVADLKIPVKVTDDSGQELTEVGGCGIDTNFYEINLEYKNSNSSKLNSTEEAGCVSPHIVHRNLTDANLKSVAKVIDHRQEQSSNFVSYNSLADAATTGISTEFTNVDSMPNLESCNDSNLEFTNVAAYKPAEIAGISFSKETHCHDSEQTEECQLELSGPKSSDSSLEFTKIVKHKSFIENSDNSGLEFTNITRQNQLRKNTESNQQITDLVQNLHEKDSDDSHLEFTSITEQKLLAKNIDVSHLKLSDSSLEFTKTVKHKSFLENSDISGLEFTNITGQTQLRKNTESNQQITDLVQNLHAKDSDDSHLEFTGVTGQKLFAKNIDVCQLGITDINRQNLKFTNFTMHNVPAKAFDSSQLEFTNTGQKLPAEDSHDSQLEFTNAVSLKQATKVTNVSQMEITDSISQKPATNSNISQLEFTNVTIQKPSTEDFDDSLLGLTNNTRQKLSAKVSDNSQVVFANISMQNPLAEDSTDSQQKVTDTAKHKLAAKHLDSQLELTNIAGQELIAKDAGVGQLDITSITMQKLIVKTSADNQFINNTSDKLFEKDADIQTEGTNIAIEKLSIKDFNESQLEFTNNTRQKMHKNDSDDCMDFTSKTRQKLLEKDFDDSQLQFTNITRTRLPEKFSDVGEMEFTNFIGNYTATKDFNGSQLEFTGTAECIPAVKNSVDVELEFSTCKYATDVSDTLNCSKKAEAIHLEHTLDCLKIPKELKLQTAAFKGNDVEGNYDQTDCQIFPLNVISREPASEICDENFINRKSIDNASNHNVDGLADASRKIRREELNKFFVRDGSQLELTNVVGIKPMAESCESRTVIFGSESAKAVEEGKCFESSVITDITDAIRCRKNPESQMELADMESHPEYSAKCPYAEREENVDMTELSSNVNASRKRNINDISCNHSNDCELECSNMKYFRSGGRADALVTTGAKTEISEITSCKSFTEKHLELSAITELKKASLQHTEVMIPQNASGSQIDVTNTINCGTPKNSAGCTSLTLGVPSMNLYECRNNDSMELTNKQNYVSQLSGSLEFTACVKDMNNVFKDNLLQEKPQLLPHLKGSETDNSEQEISLGSDQSQSDNTASIHQDDFTHAIGITDSNVSPNKDVIRNDAYRAKYLPLTTIRQQKKMQAAQNLLNVTIVSDEAFLFESCTGTFVQIDKLQSSKLEDKTNSYPSSPENAIYKIKAEVKENQKQNIEHMHTKDINLYCEPAHMLLEDELITLNHESSYNDKREDEAGNSLMKIILDADKSLFGSLSTASPGTMLSSNSESPGKVYLVKEIDPNVGTMLNSSSEPPDKLHLVEEIHPNIGTMLSSSSESPAKVYIVEEIHPNLEKNRESIVTNEPEMMDEVEGNVDGQLPKIHILKQPSSINGTKIEMGNLSVSMDLLPASDKDTTSVEQTEVGMFYSRETKEIPDIQASGKEKKTVHLPNVTLTHMELYCRDSLLHDKTEEFKAAAVLNKSQSCNAVVQKPLSLEEWLRSEKHEWDVRELSDTKWSFLFLYKSLGLVLKLDAANVKDGMKYISDIHLESYLAKTSAPETHFVHHILLKKLSPQTLKIKFRCTADVPELMDIISNAVKEMKLFLKDFFFMETCKLMEMKDNRVSFKMSDMHIHSVFRVSVDLNNWEKIRPEDVTVEDLMGTINKKEVQNLVNAVPKGPTFLSEYVNIIREYISVLCKK